MCTDALPVKRIHTQPENVHALEGLACRARVAPASSPAAPASRVRRLRLRQAFSRMFGHKIVKADQIQRRCRTLHTPRTLSV
jgi:hypothetical protein